MAVKLRKYQKRGVRKIERFHGRLLHADDMGLGKTIQILYWLSKHPELRPAIIVCPATVKYQWKDMASKMFHMRATILNGRKPSKPGLTNLHPLIIINYEILPYWIKYLRRMVCPIRTEPTTTSGVGVNRPEC